MRKLLITICLCVVACITLVVWTLPRDSKFGYAYELNRPWQYAPLIAHYDFPIYKSDAQISADRDSALARFQPFFTETDSMAQRQAKHLLSDWQAGLYKNVTYRQVNHVAGLLEKIYEFGIMSNEDMTRLHESNMHHLRIINGTKATIHSAEDAFTPLAAYEYIMHADTVNFHRQELAALKLSEYLKPNLAYDSLRSKAAMKDMLDGVSTTVGMVQSGQKIVDRGEIITEETLQILDSFRKESELRKDETSNFRYLLIGQTGATVGIVVLLLVYLAIYRRDILRSPHHVAMIFTLTALFPVLTSLMVRYNFGSVYLLPYAIAPIFVRMFIDSRTASMQLFAMILLSSLALHQPYAFIMTKTMEGIVAIYSLRELTARSQIFKSALIVTFCSALFLLFFDFAQGATFRTLDLSAFTHIFLSGVLLLFAYPLMYLMERVFAFTSDVTLVELTNTNNPVLLEMSKVAQGTFVHSMQVANLASEVANKIGASSQLVRTGALYHDIGKMNSPVFFTENQSGQNPHDQLSEEQSAGIIINHVVEGLKMADKYNLPEDVRNFILTHHGTSRVGYFYQQAVNRRGEDRVNADDFTYPGRNPFTREQAILMMADSVEAASRSLKEYTEESIQTLVDRIIDGQLQAGYFRECPITFRDITTARQVFCDSLKTIYHTRISYPADTTSPRQSR